MWRFPLACTDLKTNTFPSDFCCIVWFVWISHNIPLKASISLYFLQLTTHLLFIEIPFSTAIICHKLKYGLQITQQCKGGYERTMSGSVSLSEGAGEEADWTFTGHQPLFPTNTLLSLPQSPKQLRKGKMHLHHLILWCQKCEGLCSTRDSEEMLLNSFKQFSSPPLWSQN